MEPWEVEGYTIIDDSNLEKYKKNFKKIFYRFPYYSGYDCFKALDAADFCGYHIAVPEHRKSELVVYDNRERLSLPPEKFERWEKKAIDEIENCIREAEKRQRGIVQQIQELDGILKKIDNDTDRQRARFLLRMITDQYSDVYDEYLSTRFGDVGIGMETLGPLALYCARSR